MEEEVETCNTDACAGLMLAQAGQSCTEACPFDSNDLLACQPKGMTIDVNDSNTVFEKFGMKFKKKIP